MKLNNLTIIFSGQGEIEVYRPNIYDGIRLLVIESHQIYFNLFVVKLKNKDTKNDNR